MLVVTDRRTPRRGRGDVGFTLIELFVAMTILVIILAVITPTYIAMSQSSSASSAMTAEDSEFHPALVTLSDQTISSGTLSCSGTPSGEVLPNGVTLPACTSGGAGFYVTMYTNTSSGGTCHQWGVYYDSQLPVPVWHLGVRSFAPTSSGSPQSAVAFQNQGLTLAIVNATRTNQPQPFTTTGSGGDLLDVNLWIQATNPNGSVTSHPVQVETALAAQGSSRPAGSTTCNPPPVPAQAGN